MPVAIFIYVYARATYIIRLHRFWRSGWRGLNLQLNEQRRLQGIGTESDVLVLLVVVTLLSQSGDNSRTFCFDADDAEGVSTMKCGRDIYVTDNAVCLFREIQIGYAVEVIDGTRMDIVANALLQGVARIGTLLMSTGEAAKWLNIHLPKRCLLPAYLL